MEISIAVPPNTKDYHITFRVCILEASKSAYKKESENLQAL